MLSMHIPWYLLLSGWSLLLCMLLHYANWLRQFSLKSQTRGTTVLSEWAESS